MSEALNPKEAADRALAVHEPMEEPVRGLPSSSPPRDESALDESALDESALDEAPLNELPLDESPRELAPRVRTWWRLSFLLNAVLPSVALGALGWFALFDQSIRPTAALASLPWVIAAVVAARVPGRRYAAWRYRVTADALRLDRGVLFRVESVVPYTRIQHVDTEQGPLERLLGLSRVTVHTASGSGSSLTIPGLLPADAEALREQLATLAGVVEPL